MIKPVRNQSISSTTVKIDKTVSKSAELAGEELKLSGYEIGRAIFARNNINFKSRNCTVPIEVTELYNKKIEGKDHLDLPNIHVYEYPDTNLQVFVDADENIITSDTPYEIMSEDNCTILDFPQVFLMLQQVNNNQHDLLKEKLYQTILLNKLPEKNKQSVIATSFVISYDASTLERPSEKIKEFNKIVFDTPINKDEFVQAKEILISCLDTDISILKDPLAEQFFSPEELKTKDEMIEELETLQFDEFKEYCDNYINNLSGQMFVVISKDYFETNKKSMLSDFNKNITKVLKQLPKSDEIPGIRINKTLKSTYINNSDSAVPYSLCYAIPEFNTKSYLTDNISTRVLNNYLVPQGYTICTNHVKNLDTLKNNIPIQFEYRYWEIQPLDKNLDVDMAELIKISDIIKDIASKDLSEDLKDAQLSYKNNFELTFTKAQMPIIKNLELANYADNIFELYETVNDISEQDIKEYINKFLIEQEPIICVYK